MILHLPSAFFQAFSFLFALVPIFCYPNAFFCCLINYHLFLLLEFNFYLNLVEDLCVIYVCMWLESSLNLT